MCAIGMRGQLGLNGRLPWEGNKGREYVADVARFFDMTRGHVIIAGPRTVARSSDRRSLEAPFEARLTARSPRANASFPRVSAAM